MTLVAVPNISEGRDDAVLDEEEREERLAAILAFYDDYGRGMDGMQLPYVVECFRAVVIDRPPAGIADAEEPSGEGDGIDGEGDRAQKLAGVHAETPER